MVPETGVVNHCVHLITTKWQELPLSPCYPHRAYTGRHRRTRCIVSDEPWESSWLPGLWMLIALVSSLIHTAQMKMEVERRLCVQERQRLTQYAYVWGSDTNIKLIGFWIEKSKAGYKVLYNSFDNKARSVDLSNIGIQVAVSEDMNIHGLS